ncbi:MAG: lipopolysaccharide heptosyltransferase II, partial [bacterium]|nr:lipopolysaccharide heptosyltransferase II [bacterium]
RILIIQPSRLGDCVFCLPTVSALRKRFPNAYIAWIVDDRCQDIVTGNPDLNEVIILDRDRLQSRNLRESLRYIQELKQTLRNKQFDLTIDLNGLFKSGFLAYLTGAKYRIGSYNTVGMRELSYLFSKEIPVTENEPHVISRHLATVRYLGGMTNGTPFPIFVSEKDTQLVHDLLVANNISETDTRVVIHPGAGWLTRRWFKDRFAQVADELIKNHPVKIVLVGGRVGGKEENGLVDEIITMMQYPALNLANKITVKQLVGLLRRANLFIGNIAGPMHIAAAVSIPIIALVGPTNPAVDGPYGNNAIVIRKDLSCSFCRKKKCRTLECMERITVDEVVSAAENLLQKSNPRT